MQGDVPLNKIIVKHMFRFCAKKMRELFKDKDHLMRKKDNCMWYYSVEDSLHTHVLRTNSWEEYNEYCEVTSQKEHSRQVFETLRDTFDMNKVDPLDVVFDGKYLIVDNGVHRLSLMYHFGHIKETFPLRLLNIRFNDTVQKRIANALQSTVGGQALYNGWTNRTLFGYHSFELGNMKLIGQRSPTQRLNQMRDVYSFKGKKVLDLGCNTGGMLFHCFEMAEGVGLEYDERCVKAAGEIQEALSFLPPKRIIQSDLESERIAGRLAGFKPDCVFLLSMGSWIRNWRSLYQQVLELEPEAIWMETNNASEGEAQLAFFVKAGMNVEKISGASEDDSTGNYGRSLYFITKV